MNFIKLYIGDYQRDTGHLSITEHGAYMLMLQHYYATEKPLPTGKALHRLLRAETKTEREAIDMVTRQFWTGNESGLVNARADEEIQKADHQRTVNREIGLRGGRPRQTEPITESVSETGTEPITESEPNRNPNQTPDTRLKSRVNPLPAKPARFDPASLPIPEGLNTAKWGEWIAYRRARRLTTAEPTIRKQLEFLTQCQARGQPPDAVIDASIANGWQGLFELKGSGNGKNGSSRADRVSATIAELTGANRDPARVIDGTAARVD